MSQKIIMAVIINIFKGFLFISIVLDITCTPLNPTIYAKTVVNRDFAPIGTGTSWEYSYYYSIKSGTSYKTDSSIIRIELISQQIHGNDTVFLLSVKEEGTWMSYRMGDSVSRTGKIDSTYIDTAILSDSSISPAPGYRCRIFPLWKSHTVRKDSLGRCKIGDETRLKLIHVASLGLLATKV
jgi:hypothetical protein